MSTPVLHSAPSKPIRIANYGHIGREYFATVLPLDDDYANALLDKEVTVISTNDTATAKAVVHCIVPFRLSDIDKMMPIRHHKYECTFRHGFQQWKDTGKFPDPVGEYPPMQDMWPVGNPIQWALKLLNTRNMMPDDIVYLLIFQTKTIA